MLNGDTGQEKTVPLVAYRIADWKSRLIDLTRHNNLLYWKPTKRGSLDIISPDLDTVFKRLVQRRGHWEFWLPPEDINKNDSEIVEKPSLKVNQLFAKGLEKGETEQVLKNLQRRSLSDFRERGVRILHMAFGMLVWRDFETNEEIRSPLVLVPVELVRKSIREPFEVLVPPVEEDAVLNPALQVRLRKDVKVELPPLPEEWGAEGLSTYLSAVAEKVKDLGWSVERVAEIGLFSFYKLVIYKDLEANEQMIIQHPLIQRIAGDKSVNIVLDSLPEEKDIDQIESPDKTFQV
ncbi:DUF4011 domain-containing protein, partial [Candidatus Bathyarchaeota archaeon]|nr:DUF4011 domain-containing protein [Candidatus Bathyarchaeota archaeon]